MEGVKNYGYSMIGLIISLIGFSKLNKKKSYIKRLFLNLIYFMLGLIDNVQNITFNFSGNSYKVNRKQVEELYPNYHDIVSNEINKDNFNKYLENKMNDSEFVKTIFNKIFVN